MSDDDEMEALEDLAREHRYEQAALRLRRQDIPAGKVARYASVTDMSDETLCDVVWVDRSTGKEVIRYDGADPANTNSYYGAIGDEEMFRRLGLDPYETIDEAIAKPLPIFPVYDGGWWDGHEE